MTRKMSKKSALFQSVIALLLCFSMLIGTTFAWFTDEVSSVGNKIQSGNLKVDLELLDEETKAWKSIKESKEPLFTYENWEPGYTDVTILKIENEGNLALKWMAQFVSAEKLSILADVIDVYVNPSATELAYPEERTVLDSWQNVGNLTKFINTLSDTTYGFLEAEEEAYLGIALHMQETAGNEYQGLILGDFDIKVLATQHTSEDDSFDDQYDKEATYPAIFDNVNMKQDVTGKVTDGKLTEEVVFADSTTGLKVVVPVGTKLEDGVTEPVLTITEDDVNGNITLGTRVGYDVTIEGIADDNTAVILVTMPGVMPKEQTAIQLFHDGKAMTRVYTVEELSGVDGSGNDTYGDKFIYDAATGDVTFALTHFSNVSIGTDNKVVINGTTYTNVVKVDLASVTDSSYTVPADGNIYVISWDSGDTTKKNTLTSTTTHTWYNINPGKYSETALKVEKGARVVLNGVNIRTSTSVDALEIVHPSGGRNQGVKTYIYIADGTNNWLTGKSGVGFADSYVGADVYIEGRGNIYGTALAWGRAAFGVSEHGDGNVNSMHFNVNHLRAIPMNNSAGIGSGGNAWRTLERIEFNGNGLYQVYSGGNAASIGGGINDDWVGEIVINGGNIHCYNQPWTAYWATMGSGCYSGVCKGIYVSKDATVNQWVRSTPVKEYATEVVKGFEPMNGELTVNGPTMYSVGDTLNVDSVTVGYRDVPAQTKTSGFTVGSVDMTTSGRKTVSISYKENGNTIYSTFAINVKDAFNAIIATPNKNIYNTGYTLTAADFNVSAIASDGTKGDISGGCTISNVDMSTAGQKTVTITYTNPASGKTISTTCQINVVNTTVLSKDKAHNLVYFVPDTFYLGSSQTAYMYSQYTKAELNNTELYTLYVGEFPGGANGEKATGFNNYAYPVTGDVIAKNNIALGHAQYGMTITDAIPWTTVGAGFIAGYDTPAIGVGYYIDGDVNTLKYHEPDFFNKYLNDPNYAGFLDLYGTEGFKAGTKFTLTDFEAGSKHTVTWVVVFEDGIQKVSDWTITMKSSFGDSNYFKDTPEKPNVNVVVLSGQSNAAGATVITQNDINKYSSIDYKNVYIQYKNVYFDGAGNLIENDENMMNGGFEEYQFGISGFQSNTFGPEAALAYHLATDPALKNQQWFIVKYAAPGTSLNLHWQNNTNLSQKMMNYVQGCVDTLSKDYDVQIRSFLWMQGENDAIKDEAEANKVSAENYAVNEQNLVSAFRLKFAKYASRPNGAVPGSGIGFITAGIAPAGKDGRYLWEYSDIVNAAKVNNAQIWYVPGTLTEYSALYGKVGTTGRHNNPSGAICNSAYIDTSHMTTQAHDTAHYDQTSMDWLGTWFGQYVGVLMAEEGNSDSSGSTVINKTTYTVTLNDGSSSRVVIVAKDGYTVLGTPVRADYVFKGWSDGSKTYAAGDTYTPTKNVTLTAQWEGLYYTVTYNANGGSVDRTSDRKK